MSYYGVIVTLEGVRKHPGGDRIQLATCLGNQVVVGLEAKDGDLNVYFPVDGKLSEEFLTYNNLLPVLDDQGKRIGGGFFDVKGRVRAQKFRGERSEGFAIPVASLEYTGYPTTSLKVGDQITELNGHKICEKYVTEKTARAQRAQQLKTAKVKVLNFPEHVDTEQFRFVAKDIPAGSLVYISAKEHGTCLVKSTKITMADGSKKKICDIKTGDIVLGRDNTGKLVNSVVTKGAFTTGKTREWTEVYVKNPYVAKKKGHKWFKITCTPDHPIGNKNGYTEAKDLAVSDPVILACFDLALTQTQFEGDSTISGSHSVLKPYEYYSYVEDIKHKARKAHINTKKYDITTETSNFFANNILVHNSQRYAHTLMTRNWIQGYVVGIVPVIKTILRATPLRQYANDVCRVLNNVLVRLTSARVFVTRPKYIYAIGTRRTVLDQNANTSFYQLEHGSEQFRYNVVRGIPLHKGEILYGEVVGWVLPDKPIMSQSISKEVKKSFDKEFSRLYPGDQMVYKYGVPNGSAEFHVYRIAHVNEDGVVYDLPWTQVVARCKELGLKTVQLMPELFLSSSGIQMKYDNPFLYNGNVRDLQELVNSLLERPSVLDPSHLEEGVVLRVEQPDGVIKYIKQKSFAFGTLEGYLKLSEDYVDIEEAS